jgi:peptidoglycan-associated lipoprotein
MMNKVFSALLLTSLLGGCLTTNPAGQSALADSKTESKPVTSNAAVTAPASTDQLSTQALAGDQKKDASKSTTGTLTSDTSTNGPSTAGTSSLAKRSVYFPLDVDSLQDQDKAVIQAHGEYLAAHSASNVRVEGNADERGSSEYNLALGQRRAENTKRGLVASGANAGQIEPTSYGEEKPVDTGHNEVAWALNRRADIVYK